MTIKKKYAKMLGKCWENIVKMRWECGKVLESVGEVRKCGEHVGTCLEIIKKC